MSDEQAPTIDPEMAEHDREIDRGFGMAIVIGAAVGIVFFIVLIAAIVASQWDLNAWSVAAVAVWTGIWAGLFIGGTITVGRWSKNMH